MANEPQFRDLSSEETELVRLLHRIDYGEIHDLHVRGGQPLLDPLPEIVCEYKFGARSPSPHCSTAGDTHLKEQIVQLIHRIREMKNGKIEALKVKAGLPLLMRKKENWSM